MEAQSELLRRVRDDAAAISQLARAGMNIPLERYIDRASLDALCDSMALEPDEWRGSDLENILIIRDGLYTLSNSLRDKGDDAEHSVDQLLGGMDRLYADVEPAFRSLNLRQSNVRHPPSPVGFDKQYRPL